MEKTFEAILSEAVEAAAYRGMKRALAEHRPQPVGEGPPALTVKESAAIVGCSEQTMYQIVRRADFDAAIRVGRSIKVLRHKLLAWMERQSEAGEAVDL